MGKQQTIKKVKGVGTIYVHSGRDNVLYLRGSYKGRDYNRSLDTKSEGEAIKWSKGLRKDIEKEIDALIIEEAVRASKSPVAVKGDFASIGGLLVSSELYREFSVSGVSGYFETFYPLTGNPNTRYDAEKVLRAWFSAMASSLKIEEVRVSDLKRENLTYTYNRLSGSLKYRNKIYIGLNKFLNWMMDNERIPREDYLRDVKKKVPTMGDIFSDRQDKLGDEKWTDDELGIVLEACRDLKTPHVHLYDYELYYLMRYMGLPPVDALSLKFEDFSYDPKSSGLVFKKNRTKVKTCKYYQPLNKGESHDKEVIRIIKGRLAVSKKGDFLFPQEAMSTAAHLAKVRLRRKQDDRTRWVSNFSDRRARLQRHLGIAVKGAKGLRATFASWWIKEAGINESDLAVWLGHSASSVMIKMFYTETSDHGHFKYRRAS